MLQKNDIPSIKSTTSDFAPLKNLGINRYNTVKIIANKTDTVETLLYKVQKASELPLFSTASNLVCIDRRPLESEENYEKAVIDSLGEAMNNLREKFTANNANNINSKLIYINNLEEKKSVSIIYPVSKTEYEIEFEKIEDYKIITLEYTKGKQRATLKVVYNQDNQIQEFNWGEYEKSATNPNHSNFITGSPVGFLPSENSLHGDNDPNIMIQCLGEVFNQVNEPFTL